MACEGCRRRREAIKRQSTLIAQRASNVLQAAASIFKPSSGAPCKSCVSRTTPKGWVNVCKLCDGQSEPTASPSQSQPVHKDGCPNKV